MNAHALTLVLTSNSYSTEIKNTPVFDVTFQHIMSGKEVKYFSNPIKIIHTPRAITVYPDNQVLDELSITSGAVKAQSQIENKRVLVYVNGMNGTPNSIRENMAVIRQRVLPYVNVKNSHFRHAINKLEEAMFELTVVRNLTD